MQISKLSFGKDSSVGVSPAPTVVYAARLTIGGSPPKLIVTSGIAKNKNITLPNILAHKYRVRMFTGSDSLAGIDNTETVIANFKDNRANRWSNDVFFGRKYDVSALKVRLSLQILSFIITEHEILNVRQH